LKHAEIINGGILEFEMGSQPASWDTGELPPSFE
jgi:putative alpha-1,2-mannosidase